MSKVLANTNAGNRKMLTRYDRMVNRLLPRGTRVRGVYELGLTGVRTIVNEGWRSFLRKLRLWLRLRRAMAREQTTTNTATTALLEIKSIGDLKRTRCSYKERAENEKRNYSQLERTEAGCEKACDTLVFTLDAMHRRVEDAVGHNVWNYIINYVNARNFTRILSLGSGTCGVEINLAKQFRKPYELVCLDFNKELLERGAKMATTKGITMTYFAQDINSLKLDQTYDLIFACAVLHHLIELEHIFNQIKSHLTKEGQFVVYDVTGRNGLLLWPEQRKIIDGLLKALPPKFSYSHFLKRNMDTFVEIDSSDASFECIRSQDILPLLQKYFTTVHLVKGFAFLRRFTDQEFGPNFDLSSSLDLKVLNFLLELDQWYVDNGTLEPESIFWVGRRPD
jgi:SAM-dependent methyltransferase